MELVDVCMACKVDTVVVAGYTPGPQGQSAEKRASVSHMLIEELM